MSSEEEVAALQSELMGAIRQRDRATCERLIATDFSVVRSNGDHAIEVVLRNQWFDDAFSDVAEQLTVTDSVVSQHGPVIVATTLWRNGEARHSATDIWEQSDAGNWQLTERHAT